MLVVGLGNPGTRYADTRHNVGFMAVDLLAAQAGGRWRSEPGCHSEVATVGLADRELLLAKPQTFMNRSGVAVLALGQRFDCLPEEMLVVFDDFLLDFGRLRFRRGGSDGGHNGLASIVESLGSQAIPRLRIGIGQPLSDGDSALSDGDIVDYVLSRFDDDESVEELIERSAQAVVCYIEEGVEAAMNRFNGC